MEITKALHRKFLDKVSKVPQTADEALIAQSQAAAIKDCIRTMEEVARSTTGEVNVPDRE